MTAIFTRIRDQLTPAVLDALPPASLARIENACHLAQKTIDEWDAAEADTNKQRARHLDAIAQNLQALAVSSLARAWWEAIAHVAGDAIYIAIRQAQI